VVIRTALDTSVILPALLSWHGDHDRADSAVTAALGTRGGLIVPQGALLEAYSVMTRLPPQFRVPPDDALALLRNGLGRGSRVVSLEGDATWELVEHVAARRLVSGAVHDAAILRCAEIAGAHRLLTLNPGDFLRFGSSSVEIITP
jgi:predicted nucleic acid-binding protein